MADNDTNGAAQAGNGAAVDGLQLAVNAQYLKDLSFENPRAPQTLMQQGIAPEVTLNVDVNARSLAADVFEVVLTMSATATAEGEAVFIVEVTYCGVVTAKAPQPDLVGLLVLVETPRILFPFARNIIANATRDGGFPPLLVNPIDFADLLRRKQENQAAAQQA